MTTHEVGVFIHVSHNSSEFENCIDLLYLNFTVQPATEVSYTFLTVLENTTQFLYLTI